MFKYSLNKGKSAEKFVLDTLRGLGYDAKENSGKDKLSEYDISINDVHFEVKYDLKYADTKNVAIEMFNPKKNKPSGLNITKSKYWVIVLGGDDIPFITETSTLKKYVEDNKPLRVVESYEKNSICYLYKWEDIRPIFRQFPGEFEIGSSD